MTNYSKTINSWYMNTSYKSEHNLILHSVLPSHIRGVKKTSFNDFIIPKLDCDSDNLIAMTQNSKYI